MLLPSTDYWLAQKVLEPTPQNRPQYCDQHLRWLESRFSERVLRLIGIYFGYQMVDVLEGHKPRRKKFRQAMDYCKKIIDGWPYENIPSYDNYLRDQCHYFCEERRKSHVFYSASIALIRIYSMFSFLVSSKQNIINQCQNLASALVQVVHTHTTDMWDNCDPTERKSGTFVDMTKLFQKEQDQLLALFLPIDDWQDSWKNSNTMALAKTIYAEEEWERCPILADALMDEGCEHEIILDLLQNHWTKFGRGVWVIDRLCDIR